MVVHSSVKERLKALIDELPEKQAERLERAIEGIVAHAEETDWQERALRLFDEWYEGDEVEYTIADAKLAGQ